MFKIDTQVSHPGHGACTITDICELNLTGQQVKYYKLVPYHGSSEIMYIPVANAEKMGLRSLVTKEEASLLLHSINNTQEPPFQDSHAKQKCYRALFANNTVDSLQGSLSAMGAIIKRKRQKQLDCVDKNMLENLQKKVMSEFAVALEMSLQDTIRWAEELILQPQ